MSKEKIFIFDTTLRDGAQTEGVDFSVEDKNRIAKILSKIKEIDEFNIGHFIIGESIIAVSYTHLTLPTKRIV